MTYPAVCRLARVTMSLHGHLTQISQSTLFGVRSRVDICYQDPYGYMVSGAVWIYGVRSRVDIWCHEPCGYMVPSDVWIYGVISPVDIWCH